MIAMKMRSLLNRLLILQTHLSRPRPRVILQRMMSPSRTLVLLLKTCLSGKLDARIFNTKGRRQFMQNRIRAVATPFCVDANCLMIMMSSRAMCFPRSGFVNSVIEASQSGPWREWQMHLIGLSRGSSLHERLLFRFGGIK